MKTLGALDNVQPTIYSFENGLDDDVFMAKAAYAGVSFKTFDPNPELRNAFSSSILCFAFEYERDRCHLPGRWPAATRNLTPHEGVLL